MSNLSDVAGTGEDKGKGSAPKEFFSCRRFLGIYEVVGIWHKNKKNVEQITSPIRFVQCDLRYGYGIEELIMDNLPARIFHLAAQSYPTVSWVVSFFEKSFDQK